MSTARRIPSGIGTYTDCSSGSALLARWFDGFAVDAATVADALAVADTATVADAASAAAAATDSRGRNDDLTKRMEFSPEVCHLT
jgi:hypothetical protein